MLDRYSDEPYSSKLPKVPANTVTKWQHALELAAQLLEVDSIAILRLEGEELNLLVSNNTLLNLGDELLSQAVIRQSQKLYLPDIQQFPEWIEFITDVQSTQVYLGFPLYWVDGTLFGVFRLLHTQPKTFSAQQFKLIEQFKTTIDKDLEIIYLSSCLMNENTLNAQKQFLENLVAIARATATNLTLEPTLQNILEVSLTLTMSEQGSLFLIGKNLKVTHSVIRGDKVFSELIIEPVMQEGLAGWVSRYHKMALINDTRLDNRWWNPPEVGEWEARSALCVPLVRGDGLLGVITLLHSECNHFSLEETTLMQAAADQMALALDNARLYTTAQQELNERQKTEEKLHQTVSALERRAREISLLNEMSELFGACHSTQEAYRVIGQITRSLFPNETGAMYIFNEARDLVEMVVHWGGGNYQPISKLDDCWSLRRGRIHVMEDSSYYLMCNHFHEPLPGSSICLPMMALGETLGLLTLSHSQANYFSEEKTSLITTVAEQIGLALANLKLQENLRNQSVRDPLTSLFNRRYMEETLEREIYRAARNHTSLSVIMIDIDFFKLLNDTYKHDGGDAVLREVANIFQAYTRQGDVVCRYGGEEFTIILPDAGIEESYRRAEELRRMISELVVQHRNLSISSVTISQGVAAFPEHGDTKEELLLAADTALYQAKQQGRNKVLLAPYPRPIILEVG
jgi:diguanylate cyclase (GGDEF)-like protein